VIRPMVRSRTAGEPRLPVLRKEEGQKLIAGFESVSILFAVVVGVPLFTVSAVIAIVLGFRRSRATGIRAALVAAIVGAVLAVSFAAGAYWLLTST